MFVLKTDNETWKKELDGIGIRKRNGCLELKQRWRVSLLWVTTECPLIMALQVLVCVWALEISCTLGFIRRCPSQCWGYRQAVTGPGTRTHKYPEVHRRGSGVKHTEDHAITSKWAGLSPPPAKIKIINITTTEVVNCR